MPKGPVLRIPNVLKDDAGTYICTASNGVGSMSADQIELRVLCKSTSSPDILFLKPACSIFNHATLYVVSL